MRILSPVIALIFTSVAVLNVASGQQSNQPKHAMTNADVVKMVKSDVPDDTIITAIQNSRTAFDTSTDGVIGLSQAGVDATVMKAIIATKKAPAARHGGSVTIERLAPMSNNISDGFAVAGIKALRAIQGSTEMISTANGALMVPQRLKSLIDDADAQAQSPEEKDMAKALNQYFHAHLAANLSKELIRMQAGNYDDASERKANATVATNASVIAYDQAESKCSDFIESTLRDRNFTQYSTPCNSLVSVAMKIE